MNKFFRKTKQQGDSGFTIAELIVIIAIIGLIAVIAIPLFSQQTKASNITVARVEARNAAYAVQSMLLQIKTLAPGGVKVTQTPATGTPTSLTITNAGGTPTSISTNVSMTAGASLNNQEADNNSITSQSDYCVAISYKDVTVYQGPAGPLSSCTNGSVISGGTSSVSNGGSTANFQVLPVFLTTTLPATAVWSSCAYGSGTFVCVENGGSGRALSSPDGVTWTLRSLPSAAQWTHVTYANGLFIATRADSANTIAKSSDGGATWSSTTMPSTAIWSSVAYGSGVWIAVSTTGATAKSADAGSWTASTAASISSVSDVAYGGGKFIAVGTGANASVGTYDGTNLTWSNSALPSSQTWAGIAYGNGMFIATYSGGAAMTSNNGSSWTASATATGFSNIGYGNGLFFLAGPGSSSIGYTSTNGTTWSSRTIAVAADQWSEPAYGAGAWVVLGRSSSAGLVGI